MREFLKHWLYYGLVSAACMAGAILLLVLFALMNAIQAPLSAADGAPHDLASIILGIFSAIFAVGVFFGLVFAVRRSAGELAMRLAHRESDPTELALQSIQHAIEPPAVRHGIDPTEVALRAIQEALGSTDIHQ